MVIGVIKKLATVVGHWILLNALPLPRTCSNIPTTPYQCSSSLGKIRAHPSSLLQQSAYSHCS